MDKIKKENQKKRRKTKTKEKVKFILNKIINFVNNAKYQDKINYFLELNCLIFENKEENKHEYYKIFQNYIKLYENNFKNFLEKNFLTKEDVLESFIHFRDKVIYKDFLEEFININNFENFKLMMVEKRLELEKETLKLLEKEKIILEDEKFALNYAIELSIKAQEKEKKNLKKISEIILELKNEEKYKDEKIKNFISKQNDLIKKIKRQTLKRMESKNKKIFIEKINKDFLKNKVINENRKKKIEECITKDNIYFKNNLNSIPSLKNLDLNQELKDLEKKFISRREFKKEKIKKLNKKLKIKKVKFEILKN